MSLSSFRIRFSLRSRSFSPARSRSLSDTISLSRCAVTPLFSAESPTPKSDATCLRVSPLVSAIRTASARNSSVRFCPARPLSSDQWRTRSLFVPFGAINAIKGAASNRDRSNADLLLRRISLPGLAADVLYQFLCSVFAASGFLVHLHSMKVTMNQKSSVVQFLKSVPQALTSDRPQARQDLIC